MNWLKLPGFVLHVAADVIRSNLAVARIVATPHLDDVRPGIVAVPTDLRGGQLVLLAHLITVTPGTISVDTSADGSVIYVHALELGSTDQLRAKVAAVERSIQEVFGS